MGSLQESLRDGLASQRALNDGQSVDDETTMSFHVGTAPQPALAKPIRPRKPKRRRDEAALEGDLFDRVYDLLEGLNTAIEGYGVDEEACIVLKPELEEVVAELELHMRSRPQGPGRHPGRGYGPDDSDVDSRPDDDIDNRSPFLKYKD